MTYNGSWVQEEFTAFRGKSEADRIFGIVLSIVENANLQLKEMNFKEMLDFALSKVDASGEFPDTYDYNSNPVDLFEICESCAVYWQTDVYDVFNKVIDLFESLGFEYCWEAAEWVDSLIVDYLSRGSVMLYPFLKNVNMFSAYLNQYKEELCNEKKTLN